MGDFGTLDGDKGSSEAGGVGVGMQVSVIEQTDRDSSKSIERP